MNSRRLLLLTIAVVAVGVFALPGTVSLFSGQHAWYNISGPENEIPCKKCHADVYEEMMSMEPLSKKLAGESSSPHSYMDENCDLCHRTCFKMTYNSSAGKYEPSSGYTYARGYGSGSEPGVEAHAVSTIECMDCHGIPDGGYWNHWSYEEYDQRCYLCHGGSGWYRGVYLEGSKEIPDRGYSDFISAGGFGLGTTDDDDPSINPRAGKHAAHKAFVLDSINNTELEGSNEACIACHTSIPVKIRWTHGRSLEFNATYDKGLVLPPTHFNTSGYKANGTVNVTSYGNYSGGANTTKFPEPVTVWS